MADLVPIPSPASGISLGALDGASPLVRLKALAAQPAVRRALPWFLGMAALGGAGLTWEMLGPVPQRVLYTQLDDSERASVVAALDKGGIHYKIDGDTGALTVDEPDVYKARMLVAQNGALALPDTGSDALDKLPLGASRAVEDEHLRAGREHELMLTIKQIDGVESVRVHIAEGEQSVFVRDTIAPSASVMLRLADGRQLSDAQVNAIVNLVAASVPGLTPDAVRVVDQHGHLLSQKSSGDSDRLELQSQMEDKLQSQISQLLTPMLGEGNFSSEVQVDLDMDQVTSAHETYDKQGALRSETQAQSQQSGSGAPIGVPGVLSNTPPPATTTSPTAPGAPAAGAKGAPTPTPSGAPPAVSGAAPVNGESSASRNYELGREVAVSNQSPGKIKRLSVAVALSATAMKKFRQADIDQIKQLVSAGIGADSTRGDQVAVMVRSFDTPPPAPTPFYEAPWFSTVVHNSVALLAVLLVLLLGVRPLVRNLRREPAPPPPEPVAEPPQLISLEKMTNPVTGAIDAEMLGRQVGMAQRIAFERPENAAIALRQMLRPPHEGAR
jgi:flagellar M-ring protein FliF